MREADWQRGASTRRRSMALAAVLMVVVNVASCFNLDTHGPIYKTGPKEAHFGYAVAAHFKGETPVILVGAPKAESGQKGTQRAGALFSCPITSTKIDCTPVRSEYEDMSLYDLRPDEVPQTQTPRQAYYSGKNGQLFGASISSQAIKNGSAIVCAPLMRFNNESAFVFGSCYQLNTDLTLNDQLVSCAQENLPTQNRHNDYSACLQGHSSFIDEDFLVTGMLGARRWTGGVYTRTLPKAYNIFDTAITKHTMFEESDNERRQILSSVFKGGDYVGYSVKVGRFGFAHEAGKRQTVVAGATRFGQHGAVVILPFEKENGDTKRMFLTEDRFIMNGTQVGAGYGYAVEVIDLNNDGFDDLLVSSPFERHSDEEGVFGGAVRVYFSQAQQRGVGQSDSVFHAPIVLRKSDLLSQFGVAVTKLGNLDGDRNGYQDFAVGAPFAHNGAGAVYIYHGAAGPDTISTKPVQEILASSLPPSSRPFRSFGFSLSGAVDVDGNGYPDLAVGSALSDTLVILRSRPVIKLNLASTPESKYIEIERSKGCPGRAKTCLNVNLAISLEQRESTSLLNLDEDVFTCTLEVLEYTKGVAKRAVIDDRFVQNWKCGKGAGRRTVEYKQMVFIPRDDPTEDYLHPLKLKFSVAISGERRPEAVKEGRSLPDLQRYPMLDTLHSSHEFEIPFNTNCGADQVCKADLSVQAVLDGISKQGDVYVSNVGEKDYLDVDFVVENKGEKAYGAGLWLSFDPEELESPSIERRGGDKKKASTLLMETIGENVTHVRLGNPMDQGAKWQFSIRFKLVRGRSQSVGRPLEFVATVNTTSEEVQPADNGWRAQLRLIKKAELDLTGVSDPATVYFGGDVKGESAIDLEEDVGIMVRHNYTLHNKGKWTVRNITAKFLWPSQVESPNARGKWALYLLDVPTVTTFHPDGTMDIKPCNVELPVEDYVNPVEIRRNTKFSTLLIQPHGRFKRSTDDDEDSESSLTNDVLTGRISFRSPSKDRIQPVERDQNGENVQVSTIGCPTRTAKCFTVTCHLDYIDANSAPIIDFRARLWNATFVEDYYDVEYVELQSWGTIEVDSNQGLEDDPSNNQVAVTTQAYPDKPSIDESRPIELWIYIVAVALGLLILAVLVFILWKCGFFKRKKYEPSLHQAQLRYEREQWAES